MKYMLMFHMNLFGKKFCILRIYAISDDENAAVEVGFLGN